MWGGARKWTDCALECAFVRRFRRHARIVAKTLASAFTYRNKGDRYLIERLGAFVIEIRLLDDSRISPGALALPMLAAKHSAIR